VSASSVGESKIPKRGDGCGQHSDDATTNSRKRTIDAGEYAGRNPKMRGSLPRIARQTASLRKALSRSMQAIQQRRVLHYSKVRLRHRRQLKRL
jgi:hypothetical protein